MNGAETPEVGREGNTRSTVLRPAVSLETGQACPARLEPSTQFSVRVLPLVGAAGFGPSTPCARGKVTWAKYLELCADAREIRGNCTLLGVNSYTSWYITSPRHIAVSFPRYRPAGAHTSRENTFHEYDHRTNDCPIPIVDETGLRHERRLGDLFLVVAIELACALCLEAIQAGAAMLNLTTTENSCVHDGQVTGVVVNRTGITAPLPVDPLVLPAEAVVDAPGHEGVAVGRLRKRNLLSPEVLSGSAPKTPWMQLTERHWSWDERQGSTRGLWVTGMTVCSTFGGPAWVRSSEACCCQGRGLRISSWMREALGDDET